MPIKSFKGQLADGQEEVIRLSTNNGLIGYKIHKFRIIPDKPYEFMSGTVKLSQYSIATAASGATVNFDNSSLLGVGTWVFGSGEGNINDVTIFDNVIFNQDIFVSFTEETTSTFNMNYYIELEQIKLKKDEAAVATLKDMRGRA